MDPSVTWKIIVIFILILLSAFFTLVETAFIVLGKLRMRHLFDDGVKGAKPLNQLMDDPEKTLNTLMIGDSLTDISATVIGSWLFMELAPNFGIPIALGTMIVLILVLGEIIPKIIGTQHAEKITLNCSNILIFFIYLLTPFRVVLIGIGKAIIRLFGGKVGTVSPAITEEEFMSILDVSHEEGVLEVEEKQMISNVVEFGDVQVSDIMVPRTDMIVADVNTSYEELIQIYKGEKITRLPIYEDNIDNIIGILNVKDLFFFQGSKANLDVKSLLRTTAFTYEFIKTAELFIDMRDKSIAMSIVLDEYGGTAGLVTLEDLIEEIVGDIRDEYDDAFTEIISINEHEHVLEGSVKIDLVNEMLHTHINSMDFDSIGGYIIGLLGHLPEKGEVIEEEQVRFIIEEVDKNRIEKIRLFLLDVPTEPAKEIEEIED